MEIFVSNYLIKVVFDAFVDEQLAPNKFTPSEDESIWKPVCTENRIFCHERRGANNEASFIER